jgi:hypothetical protein
MKYTHINRQLSSRIEHSIRDRHTRASTLVGKSEIRDAADHDVKDVIAFYVILIVSSGVR